jgi:FkbM family methyltransferase
MNDKLPVSEVQYERLNGSPSFGDYWIARNPFIQEELFDQVIQGVNPANWIVRLLQRFSKKGTLVLDIGSNIGCFAIPAALLGYEVIAFEASAPNIELLGESLKKNGLSNVRLIHAAVVESNGDVDFVGGGLTGHVSNGEQFGEHFRVPGIAIDEFLSDAEIAKISFIKIDIEGSEPAAFKGMSRILGKTTTNAPVIVFESNSTTLARVGLKPEELMKQIADCGYYLYRITPGYFTELTQIDLPYVQPAKLIDCLAVKKKISWWSRHNWQILLQRIKQRLSFYR